MEDLRDAFNYYAKDNRVTVAHFKNIIHNFGFHNLSKKDMDEELKQISIDLNKQKEFQFEQVALAVTRRLMRNKGMQAEAQECFEFIDQNNKKYVNAQDLGKVLKSETMGFSISQSEIEEFFQLAGATNKKMNPEDFEKMYNLD